MRVNKKKAFRAGRGTGRGRSGTTKRCETVGEHTWSKENRGAQRGSGGLEEKSGWLPEILAGDMRMHTTLLNAMLECAFFHHVYMLSVRLGSQCIVAV